MQTNLKEVQLLSSGVFLPGKPILFENIESILGELDDAPDKIKKIIPKLRSKIQSILKAKQCYFAIDPKTKLPTDNNASMTVKAITTALKKASMQPNDIEYIALGSPVPDYMIPSTAAYVQDMLNIKYCSEIEIHSNCTAISKAMQVAFDALRVGRYKTAVVAYSQNPSAYLNSAFYNHSKISIENLLLRWFLSDCASVVILKSTDIIKSGIQLVEVYNESVGNKLDPSMWLKFGSADFNLKTAYERGIHHFGQDYSTVNKLAPKLGVQALKRFMNNLNIQGNDLDNLVVTLPSYSLENTTKSLVEKELNIPANKWFSNVEEKGYCGGASLINCVDDMIANDILTKGKKIICFAVESSKWMNGGFCLHHI